MVRGERKRQISGQMTRPPGPARGRRRAVWLEATKSRWRLRAKVEGIAVRFVGAGGAMGASHQLVSPWKPGDPVWQGTLDGHAIAMQVRPSPTHPLAHRV